MLKYYFTNFGYVFAGWEWSEAKFPNYTIVIQGTKLKDYRELSSNEKTLDKIREYGWVLPNDSVVGVLSSAEFNPAINHFQGEWWHGEYDRTDLFIFGAGASANCVFGDEVDEYWADLLRAPLGMSLFDKRFKEIYKKYPGALQSLHALQDVKGADVEGLIEEEWKDIFVHSNEQVMSRHINIQYYLQELLKHVTENACNYHKNLFSSFADKLQKIQRASVSTTTYGRKSQRNFALVSFNQDTILDRKLSQFFKKPLNTMEDYINFNDSPFCLFKPHGSWNWGWKFPNTDLFKGDTPGWLYYNNSSFFQLYFQLLGNHVDMIDWATWGIEASLHKHRLGKYTIDKSQLQIIPDSSDLGHYYPGLLLPYRDKDEFTMPLPHYMAMDAYIGNIENLYIIGWKGNEEAFNAMLLNHGSRIKKIVIADPNPEVVKQNLHQLVSRKNTEVIMYSGFEDFVLNGMEKELVNNSIPDNV